MFSSPRIVRQPSENGWLRHATGLGALLLLASLAAAQPEWTMARLFYPRGGGCPLAYDTSRQRVVLFGGQYNSYYKKFNDTWEWDGASWILQTPVTSPSGRSDHASVYDVVRRRVVLFGGVDSNGGRLNDTWEWDGTNWTQRLSPGPSPRVRHAMAYDIARRRTVLFGGEGSSGVLNDTWEWDGTSWTQRFPAASPTSRYCHAMAYDVVRQRTVLFGGGYPYGSNETWEWDGTNWMIPVHGLRPPNMSCHGLVYDLVRQRVLLFGGERNQHNVTWEWDGKSWVQLFPATTPFIAYYDVLGMTYDVSRQRTVLLGPGPATWEWDGVDWKCVVSLAYFDDFSNIIRATDHGRRRIVAYRPGSTYEWDGEAWTRYTPQPEPNQWAGQIAYDEVRLRIVFFGGDSANTTWEWDGQAWTQRFPVSSPSRRTDHSMAYDGLRNQILLFGGNTSTGCAKDTWVWTGSNWVQLFPTTSPSARQSHKMAYDRARKRIILFGGYDDKYKAFGDTWEWDGTTWNQRFPTSSPSATADHTMAYDESRQRTLLAESKHNTNPHTWEWDGVNWSQTPSNFPYAGVVGYNPGLVYDPVRRCILATTGGYHYIIFFYSFPVRAAASPLGSACPGSNGLPLLSGNDPFLGNLAFIFDLLSARNSAPCLFACALNTQSIPLGGGCTFYLKDPFLFLPAIANGDGFASVKLKVPVDPGLRGGTFHVQAFALDPNGPFAGVAFSQGRKLVVGD